MDCLRMDFGAPMSGHPNLDVGYVLEA